MQGRIMEKDKVWKRGDIVYDIVFGRYDLILGDDTEMYNELTGSIEKSYAKLDLANGQLSKTTVGYASRNYLPATGQEDGRCIAEGTWEREERSGIPVGGEGH